MAVTVDTSGIEGLANYFDRFPVAAANAMSIALNDTARGVALTSLRREIGKEVNYPEGYLQDRVTFKSPATPTRLEARISGRDRPTSLARFVPAGTQVARPGRNPRVNGSGLTVTVRPGHARFMAGAFLIELRHGNIGFALRLKKGETTVRRVNRFHPIELFTKHKRPGDAPVFLLYGPSVDQVAEEVGEKISAEVTSELEDEFFRQFTRLTGADQ